VENPNPHMTILSFRIKTISCLLMLCLFTYAGAKNKAATAGDRTAMASQLLFGGFSKKHIVETAASHNGSVLSKRMATSPDTVHIIAFRIEFNGGIRDTTPTTTGNGLFGIQGGGDITEIKFYQNNVYKYDALYHDSTYVSDQLEYARYYFQTVSRGQLNITYSIFPSGKYAAYDVPLQMTAYGPGSKKKEETYAQYNERINVRLIKFIKDAIISANKDLNSPFSSLHYDKASGFVHDSNEHRCVFLIVHAGSSFLTDGGLQGAAAANSPSDMIDAFITPGYFDFYKDSLGIKTAGIEVTGDSPADTFLIDEIMMVSETSNQDSLNWGIHGILINQIARQLGIPDLFATSSGTTAVGAFCIMDFYGYSASPSQGFIPPWPCAWVRAFMGWDTPVVMPMGTQNSMKLKAISDAKPGDTSIVLIPLNDHEYYLLENRQRDLSHTRSIFKYDTVDNVETIDPAFSLNLDNNVTSTSKDGSNCILTVKNFDASLPASGVVVWHVDENIIKNRLKYDYLNADSSYRAITMVEADGINDIGIAFQDVFYQLAFDAGGAEDVFPHKTKKTDSTFSITGFGPFTKPSTHSNDGGQTYLKIDIKPTVLSDTEANRIRDYVVTNYSDTFFTVSASWDFLAPGWPKRMAIDSGENFFDPVLLKQNGVASLVTLSKKGRLYSWPVNSQAPASYGDTQSVVKYLKIKNDSLKNAPSMVSMDSLWPDTVRYFSLPGAFTFSTVINSNLFIPITNSNSDTSVYIIKSILNLSLVKDIVPLPSAPTTYVCKLFGNYWAVGCANGSVFSADTLNYASDFKISRLPTNSPVSAIAALANEPGKFVCIQNDNSLSLDSVGKSSPLFTIKVPLGIPPFTLVTGDINNDSVNEIIVCDSRKGLWVFKHDSLKTAPGWEQAPIDWATPGDTASDRHARAINTTAPALADINGDGRLEIIVGGSNGLYALNYKGVLINGWPAYLDNRFFRGNVACSPAVVSAPAGSSGPLVVYQSPTGENETFEIDTIIKADKVSGKITFLKTDGTLDSISGLTATYIDSAMVLGDSLILPFTQPGGLVDAIDPSGKRPLITIGSNQLYSRWPLTIGSPQGASPLIDSISGDSLISLFAIGNNGWVYRWRLTGDMVGNSLLWKQTGYDGSRPFAYLASVAGSAKTENTPVFFFSYPNPTNGSKYVVFKYKFSGPAKNVRLDIFTYTGLHVFSQANLSGSFPGENQLSPVSLANYGSGVYRCRFEAEVSGKKYVQYWKMAVVK
jgi:FG-GAP repeat.